MAVAAVLNRSEWKQHEDGVSSEHMARVCVWRGMWGMDGKCTPPPGLSGEVEPSEEMMQRHSQPDEGVGLGSPGLIC